MRWYDVHDIATALLDALVGCRCAGCGRGAPTNPCAACRDAIEQLPRARQAAVVDAAPASVLVRRAKRGDWRGAGAYLGAVLADRLAGCAAPDVVTWVAAERGRRRRRGGHLPERIARSVARQLGVPATALLIRRAGTATQQGRDREQRRRNASAAYRLGAIDPASLSGRRVLLVDDVRTTGATLDAGAEVLRRAGAHVVAIAAVGRGDALDPAAGGVGNVARSGNIHLTNRRFPADRSGHDRCER